jgi:hypothetical protein
VGIGPLMTVLNMRSDQLCKELDEEQCGGALGHLEIFFSFELLLFHVVRKTKDEQLGKHVVPS